MHAGKDFEHDKRQQKHGEEAYKAGSITVPEFEHAQSPKVPLRVGHVHPDQTCVSEDVEGVDGWNDEQQCPHAFFPRKLEYGNGTDKENHGLNGRAGQHKSDPDRFAIGE